MATLNRILPFSPDVYFRLGERYLAEMLFAQLAGFALALLVLLLILRPRPGGDKAIAAILAAFWLWSGIVWHMLYFTTIYWAAWAFGALFMLQAMLLLLRGVLHRTPRFRFTPTVRGWTGLTIGVFGLAVNPLLAFMAGHGGPAAPGGMPAPTILFTIGVLLLADERIPLRLLAIPALWALVGGLMTVPLGNFEDLSLPVAAGLAMALGFGGKRRQA